MLARVSAVGMLTLASCSDPAEPAGQGAASVHVALAAGFTCTPGPHWANVPYSPTAGQKVDATRAEKVAVDAVDGMSVTCSVVPDGAKFKVHADLRSPATLNGSALPVTNLIFDTTIGPDEEGAPGSLTVFDDKTEQRWISSTCTYSVKPAGAGTRLAVAPGSFWGSLACTKLADPGDPGAACSVDRGFLAIENCGR